jgi:phage terminase large subunit GpA-like protein
MRSATRIPTKSSIGRSEEPRRGLPRRTVPKGYVLLTAGVDVQKDRLEYLVMAWRRGMRRCVIDVGVIPCDPMREDWHAAR